MNTLLRTPLRLALAASAALALAAGCASQPGGQGNSGEQSGSVGRLLKATAADGHRLRQVDAEGAPEVRLRAQRDPHGGWNLHLLTQRFRFAPEYVNGKVRAGEGHAHLYIDGEKYTRVYSPWLFLPASEVPEGRHTLKVTLNANDHTTWAVSGHPIADTTKITSTGGGGHHHGNQKQHARGQQAPFPSATATPAADVTVRARVAGGEVSPPPRRVKVAQGQTVRLVVRSDQSTRVHVHGYDLEKPVAPSKPAVIVFTADRPGVFEVETHHPALQLLQLAVR